MLRVARLRKAFKRPVVRGVDLRADPGEVLGLLGANGAGKTTTFNMITGTLRPDGGRVLLEGQDVTSWPLYRRSLAGLGYLPQEASAFRDLSVEANLLLVLERLGLDRRERRRRRSALLAEYGLERVRRQAARTLSGGQRRRLEVARALAGGPKVMLLDEPFAGVDPLATVEIREIVVRLRDRGIAVLVTDHDAHQILQVSDRVCLMHEGQVLVRGSPQEIQSSTVARRVYLGDGFRAA